MFSQTHSVIVAKIGILAIWNFWEFLVVGSYSFICIKNSHHCIFNYKHILVLELNLSILFYEICYKIFPISVANFDYHAPLYQALGYAGRALLPVPTQVISYKFRS